MAACMEPAVLKCQWIDAAVTTKITVKLLLNKPYNTQLSELKTRACLRAHKIREIVFQSVDGE